MTSRIIAFGHRKNVGKDTAAKFLSAHLKTTRHGINIAKAGFADKIKDVAYQVYGWAGMMPGDYYEENRAAREIVLPAIGKSPRQVWIQIGNRLREFIHEATWLDYVRHRYSSVDLLIMKDMRFPVEADYILANGGEVYRIDRPDQPKDVDGADDPLENYTKWTGIIANDKTLKEFYEAIVGIGEKWRKR